MKLYSIDLYEHFNLKKPEGNRGILTCYINDNSQEVDINRLSPAMLIIPGGGYSFVSFREAEPIALRYLGFGFKCFVLNYSIDPTRHPYQLLEAVMAMNYIRSNASELSVDKNKVIATGFSAGGHLTAMLGSYYNCKEVKDIFNGKETARPDAIILGYPVITSGDKAHKGSFNSLCGDNEKLKEQLDIANLVNKDSSPAFIWSTANDGCVPIKNSLIIADCYENFNIPFSLHIFGKGAHGSSLNDLTVYGNEGYKDANSSSINSWVELSLTWLKELNLFI